MSMHLVDADIAESRWKEQMEERLNKLEQALAKRSTPPDREDAVHSQGGMPDPPDTIEVTLGTAVPQHQTEDTGGLNLSCSLGAFPASSMGTANGGDRSTISNFTPDLISCGVISLEAAEHKFAFYQRHLNPFVHDILATKDSLADVRRRSPLLSAAICTVASSCTGSTEFQDCLKAFKAEVSRQIFAEEYDFDDVRALCIGAFWLNEISTILVGLGMRLPWSLPFSLDLTPAVAVRIGIQLDLHRCISKMPHTKRACYDRTRLYFLVYVCDHHCSLIYGRPPMTREWRSFQKPRALLQSQYSTATDLFLISQVEFWSVSRQVFEHFGADIERNVLGERAVEIKRLSEAYDRWYEEWGAFLTLAHQHDPILHRIFDLHYHSGKLYLFSHIFRGKLGSQTGQSSYKETSEAQNAVASALFLIRCITEADNSSSWLGKLPFYFGTMIAFACVCLIKTALQDQPPIKPKSSETLQELSNLAILLRHAEIPQFPGHPLMRITKSLETATVGTDQGMNMNAEMVDQQLQDFDFDAFLNEIPDLSFPGGDELGMMSPDEPSNS